MTRMEAERLKPGDKVKHSHYGIGKVQYTLNESGVVYCFFDIGLYGASYCRLEFAK